MCFGFSYLSKSVLLRFAYLCMHICSFICNISFCLFVKLVGMSSIAAIAYLTVTNLSTLFSPAPCSSIWGDIWGSVARWFIWSHVEPSIPASINRGPSMLEAPDSSRPMGVTWTPLAVHWLKSLRLEQYGPVASCCVACIVFILGQP